MITVKFFGTFRLDSGLKTLELPGDGQVRTLYPLIMAELHRTRPDSGLTEKDLKSCLIIVNGKSATARTPVKDGDTVYFMTPAAGG